MNIFRLIEKLTAAVCRREYCLESRVTALENEVRKMADELANVKTAEANLQTQVSAMIADLQRVVKDVQALQASAAGGNDVTADAATITQELNDMSTALANAQASIDAADPAAPAS